MARIAAVAGLVSVAMSQQIGEHVAEEHPSMPIWTCDAMGCTKERKSVVLDSNWRWIHNGEYTNCYKDSKWDPTLCPDPETCSKNCHLDGVSKQDYQGTYGIKTNGKGIKLDFVTEGEYGNNYGSRVYLLDNENKYKLFKLKNREFSLTVDMNRMPCGLNGAVYFVEMDADGGKAASGGLNNAGAKYGTGYCDAQCPHDMKFIQGHANVINWNSTSDPPIGHHGICCFEMDIWEANSRAAAYTPHPCSTTGPYRCEGVDCGDNTAGERYKGVCDKDGCDFNSYRMGALDFYGRGGDFTLDAKKKLQVVTQFVTSDGTDNGDLVDIRRFYVQDGVVVPNSESSLAGVPGNSVTDQFCNKMKDAFGDINDHKRLGGLKAMGDALDRGMVLVMSLWDDSLANMLWLDAPYPVEADPNDPGVRRGPCRTDTGSPAYLRRKYPTASAEYTDIKVGTLGSTFDAPPGFGAAPGGEASDDPFGDDRRLKDVVV